MWNHLILVILSILAGSHSFLVVPEDEIVKGYHNGRGLLSIEQQEFLMELLAADDALIESRSRGIVDDILQTLAGSSGIRINVLGGQPASASSSSNTPQQPSLNIISPSFSLVGSSNAQKTLLNATDTARPMSDISSSSGGASSASSTATNKQQMQGNVTTIGGDNNYLLSTISQVIRNSNSRNVTGIVDQSLRIATPAPIREFVTGILNVVYCNSIRRLLGRC